MWAPIAAIVLAIGIVNTPSMIEAEKNYLREQEPVIDVQGIEAADVKADPAPDEVLGEVN